MCVDPLRPGVVALRHMNGGSQRIARSLQRLACVAPPLTVNDERSTEAFNCHILQSIQVIREASLLHGQAKPWPIEMAQYEISSIRSILYPRHPPRKHP